MVIEIQTEAMKMRYDKNDTSEAHTSAGKDMHMLCRTDRLFGAVQVVRSGGENNLHSHSHLDGFWFVLRGKVRFYGEGDEVIGDCGPGEGMLIPRGVKYWFESSSDEELELLQVEASDVPLRTFEAVRQDRRDFAPVKDNSLLSPESI